MTVATNQTNEVSRAWRVVGQWGNGPNVAHSKQKQTRGRNTSDNNATSTDGEGGNSNYPSLPRTWPDLCCRVTTNH
eukprot:2010474-Amphidinium_carterae.3